MLILTIVFCVHGDVSACQRTKAAFHLPGACALAAQQEAATWVADHPAYRVLAWRCGRA